MNKYVRYGLIALGIILLMYVFAYCFSLQSDAYAATKKFIRQSSVVKAELGEVTAVQLKPFAYNIEFAGNEGSADFVCAVEGDKKRGDVQVILEKNGKGWQIKKADLKLEGRIITLLIN